MLAALGELGKLLGEKRVVNAAGRVLQAAAQAKTAVDDNVAMALGLAGLPSRKDVEGLRRQLDIVQATLANLSRKVDRLLEEAAPVESRGGSVKPARKSKSKPRVRGAKRPAPN